MLVKAARTSSDRIQPSEGIGLQLEGKEKKWQHLGASESAGKYWLAWEAPLTLYLFSCRQGGRFEKTLFCLWKHRRALTSASPAMSALPWALDDSARRDPRDTEATK